MSIYGCFLPVVRGRKRPILLKKSTVVSTAEKYALEIEIFTSSRGLSGLGFRVAARKKGVFSSQYAGNLEGPTFSIQSTHSGHSKTVRNESNPYCRVSAQLFRTSTILMRVSENGKV
jgi:hypothetical protein